MTNMKVYSFDRTGSDGLRYSVRVLLTPEELRGLQKAQIVPIDVEEIVGMQGAADELIAEFEKDNYLSDGNRLM